MSRLNSNSGGSLKSNMVNGLIKPISDSNDFQVKVRVKNQIEAHIDYQVKVDS